MTDQTTMTFRPSPEQRAIIEALAATTGKNPSKIIREALDQYLAKIDTNQVIENLNEAWQQQQKSHNELVELLLKREKQD